MLVSNAIIVIENIFRHMQEGKNRLDAAAEDAAAKAIVKKPVAVYVEKVYEEGDFSGLGIVS